MVRKLKYKDYISDLYKIVTSNQFISFNLITRQTKM